MGLILITILSLALVGYTALNPHLATVTQQQFVTNTQNLYSTQTQTQTVTSIGTQTVTSIGTVTSITTAITTTTAAYGYGYGNYYQNCGYYGCNNPNPGYSYYQCQSAAYGYTVQCSGYLYQDASGCIELEIPVTNWVNNPYTVVTTAMQYYTLHNLPSSIPPIGSWVTVTGQLYQGYNTGPNGAACPGNYINIITIT
jgi:hypothetical protein